MVSKEAGISVVVPTLNEALNLPELLERIATAIGPDHSEVIIVDDHSDDGTSEVAQAIAKHYPLPLHVMNRDGRRSLSAAVLCGARKAQYRWVAVLDADLSHPPEILRQLLEIVQSNQADIAIGSRYVSDGRIENWKKSRKFLSGIGTLGARLLTSSRDPLSGFFVCECALLDGTTGRAKAKGFKILLEVLARNPAARVKEVPITFADRKHGTSKLGTWQAICFLVQLVTLSGSRLVSRITSASYRRNRNRDICAPVN